MRKFFESLGGLFGQVGFDAVMGIIVAVIALIKTAPLGWIIVALVAVPIGCRAVGVFFSWLSETIPANVRIIALKGVHDFEDIYYPTLNKRMNYNYADLRVINREFDELTECYGVLRNVSTFDIALGFVDLTPWFFIKSRDKKIAWRNGGVCEMKIGPYRGQEDLRLYRLGVNMDGHLKEVSDFNICDPDYTFQNMGLNDSRVGYFFNIEIYGKLRGRDIKPTPFFGLVGVEFVKRDDGASYGVGVQAISKWTVAKLKVEHWIFKGKQKAKIRKQSIKEAVKKE